MIHGASTEPPAQLIAMAVSLVGDADAVRKAERANCYLARMNWLTRTS